MSLSNRQVSHLIKIMEGVQSILQDAQKAPAAVKSSKSVSGRTRRTGKELVEFKKMVLKEKRAGVSVAELAEKYGVTPSYLYQLQ